MARVNKDRHRDGGTDPAIRAQTKPQYSTIQYNLYGDRCMKSLTVTDFINISSNRFD